MTKQIGDGGISDPTMHATEIAANASETPEEKFIREKYNMTPDEYWAWRSNMANSRPEDIE